MRHSGAGGGEAAEGGGETSGARAHGGRGGVEEDKFWCAPAEASVSASQVVIAGLWIQDRKAGESHITKVAVLAFFSLF